MRSITIKKDMSFDLPAEFQSMTIVTIRMPYSVKHFSGNSIATYFRQPRKEKPYVDDGFIEIRCGAKSERFMAVNEDGKQIFWRDADANKK